jgi:hypothetical protein
MDWKRSTPISARAGEEAPALLRRNRDGRENGRIGHRQFSRSGAAGKPPYLNPIEWIGARTAASLRRKRSGRENGLKRLRAASGLLVRSSAFRRKVTNSGNPTSVRDGGSFFAVYLALAGLAFAVRRHAHVIRTLPSLHTPSRNFPRGLLLVRVGTGSGGMKAPPS